MNRAFGIVLLINLAIIAIVMTWAEIMFAGQNESIAIAFDVSTLGTGLLNILSGFILLLIGIQKKSLRVFAYCAFILALLLLLCGVLILKSIAARH